MKKSLNFIKVKFGLLGAVLLAAIVGGLSSAVVMAAIPDNNGVIHGCIRPANDNLRIIDSSTETCTAGQTSLNWDKDGVKAYGHIRGDGTIDSARTKNITSISNYDADSDRVYCLELSTSVKNVSVTAVQNSQHMASVDPTEWTGMQADLCSSNTDAVVKVDVSVPVDFYVTFH